MVPSSLLRPTTGGAWLAAAILLAACGPETPAEPTPAPAKAPPAAAPPSPPAPQGETLGGDGSAIVLTPLSSAEIEAAGLEGELACSFAAPDAPPLLVAMGDAASRSPSQGVVKVADSVERVAAPGGFDAMLKGAVFTGAGKTLRLAVTGPPLGGGESPPRAATLTYQRADGASRAFTGLWTCGP